MIFGSHDLKVVMIRRHRRRSPKPQPNDGARVAIRRGQTYIVNRTPKREMGVVYRQGFVTIASVLEGGRYSYFLREVHVVGKDVYTIYRARLEFGSNSSFVTKLYQSEWHLDDCCIDMCRSRSLKDVPPRDNGYVQSHLSRGQIPTKPFIINGAIRFSLDFRHIFFPAKEICRRP